MIRVRNSLGKEMGIYLNVVGYPSISQNRAFMFLLSHIRTANVLALDLRFAHPYRAYRE